MDMHMEQELSNSLDHVSGGDFSSKTESGNQCPQCVYMQGKDWLISRGLSSSDLGVIGRTPTRNDLLQSHLFNDSALITIQ